MTPLLRSRLSWGMVCPRDRRRPLGGDTLLCCDSSSGTFALLLRCARQNDSPLHYCSRSCAGATGLLSALTVPYSCSSAPRLPSLRTSTEPLPNESGSRRTSPRAHRRQTRLPTASCPGDALKARSTPEVATG